MGFGPNKKASFDGEQTFHHREKGFHELYTTLTSLLRRKFSISEEWDILFLTGSGTLANEAVIFSMDIEFTVLYPKYEFATRLEDMLECYEKRDEWSDNKVLVAYETADSKFNGTLLPEDGLHFVDMVSAFPYYQPPPNVGIWTAVSSKQLGAVPIISMVFVHHDSWEEMICADDVYSYLNLDRYRVSQKDRMEPPHTPAIGAMIDFVHCLNEFDREKFIVKVSNRRNYLMEVIPDEKIVGEGPVLSIAKDWIPEGIADKFALYRGNEVRQVFLYSGSDTEYENLHKELKSL